MKNKPILFKGKLCENFRVFHSVSSYKMGGDAPAPPPIGHQRLPVVLTMIRCAFRKQRLLCVFGSPAAP